ncbi:pyridoxamine 5'-phosphate oxidase family protein [Marinobacterium sp. D7]|uniref:pyridoxamine 5'-phosphate oxidase family protein n=1 Tax=Marinobacterium ramblicola TaxID=2849041 RepID=UPI001C2DB9EE|nr:pyridoxamine 5'-phosphate oxidase family protein [Marinobacterium ramblicola]MBV1787214.1 pyridoxamine 5'-phosphate oxidase family protein [Marinobacterium ramblicola]
MGTQAFHAGELEIQRRAGVPERTLSVGEKVLRPLLIDQHRQFYPQLPMLFLAATDSNGVLWATALYGEPGFIGSPDERTLSVRADWHAADPLHDQLRAGQPYGLLGLQFATRRRNRANGKIQAVSGDRLLLGIEQSFGNCPKYIRPREIQGLIAERSGRSHELASLDGRAAELIERSDTFFIASRAAPNVGTRTEPQAGYDISHRGGQAGFVQVPDPHSLVFADFKGNDFFNTLGNIQTCSETALLFIDFDSGDHLYLNGHASLLWSEEGPLPIPGYARNVRFRFKRGMLIERLSPYRWHDLQADRGTA